MKYALLFLFLILSSVHAFAKIKQTKIPYKVIGDTRIFAKDINNKFYSNWTDKQDEAIELLKSFKMLPKDFLLPKDHILVIFSHDAIVEDLVSITHNATANKTVGDYADSGIRINVEAPPAGKKWSHITAVIFKPIGTPNHIGIRSPQHGKLSKKE